LGKYAEAEPENREMLNEVRDSIGRREKAAAHFESGAGSVTGGCSATSIIAKCYTFF